MAITDIEKLRAVNPEKAEKIERDFAAGKFGKDTAARLVKLALMDS